MITKTSYKQIIPIGLFALLSWTGTCYLIKEIVASQVVIAQTTEINLPIARQKYESYEDLLRRAEVTAKKTIQGRFQKDALVSELKIAIMGENQGAIAPILSVRVSRSGWQKSPNIQRWATYYADSKLLLGFEQPKVAPQPEVQQPATEEPQPSPEAQQPSPETQQPNVPTEEPQQEQPPSPLERITPGERR